MIQWIQSLFRRRTNSIPGMDDLVRDARRLRLTNSEQEQTRMVITEFIGQHPPQDVLVSPASPWTLWSRKPIAAFALALVVVIGIGRQGVLAAERALPGDRLYPLKVNIVEPIKGATRVSLSAKGQWQKDRARARLEEAEQLAAQKRLDTDTQADLQQRFLKHTQAVQVTLATLKDQQDVDIADDLSTQFEATLRAHTVILETLGAGPTSALLSPLRISLEDQSKAVASASKDIEGEIRSDKKQQRENIVRRQTIAQNTVSKAEALLKQSGPSPVREKVIERVERAKDQLSAGVQKFDEQDDRRAITSLRDAQRSALEAEELINAQNKLSSVAAPKGSSSIESADVSTFVRVKVITDRPQYTAGQQMIVTVSAANQSDHSVKLNIPSGCPATMMIDNQVPPALVCPDEITLITIDANTSRTWVFRVATPEGSGDHRITGSVVGYGSDETSIRVIDAVLPPLLLP
ncbi:hypothetical protein HZA86_01205 [Candidatus Uhrbacteria bacterium]|nr:hypothetical protein [Candidatus Uhrbacteria bacterium]